MAYIQGFVTAVPAENRAAYEAHAREAIAFMKELGVTRAVEAWGDLVPEGKVTDFRRAVQAKPNEVIVFSWFEIPSKQAADAARDKMMSDPRMEELMKKGMPFDGARMIYGGFEVLIDE